MNKRILLIAIGALLAITLTGLILLEKGSSTDTSSLFKSRLTSTDGKIVNPNSLLGKPVIINFWASWCEPCIEEMPDLSQFYLKHQSKIQLVGISVENAENLKAFFKNNKVSYTLLAGGEEAMEVSADLGNIYRGTPYTVVLDRQGKVVLKQLGKINIQALEKRLYALQLL